MEIEFFFPEDTLKFVLWTKIKIKGDFKMFEIARNSS